MANTTPPTKPPPPLAVTGQSGNQAWGDTSWWTGDAETATVNTWNEYVDTLKDLRLEVDVSGTDVLPQWSNGSVSYSFGSGDEHDS